MFNTIIINSSKVYFLWEVLAKKTISIFIQASLPGMIRVSKIDISYLGWSDLICFYFLARPRFRPYPKRNGLPLSAGRNACRVAATCWGHVPFGQNAADFVCMLYSFFGQNREQFAPVYQPFLPWKVCGVGPVGSVVGPMRCGCWPLARGN